MYLLLLCTLFICVSKILVSKCKPHGNNTSTVLAYNTTPNRIYINSILNVIRLCAAFNCEQMYERDLSGHGRAEWEQPKSPIATKYQYPIWYCAAVSFNIHRKRRRAGEWGGCISKHVEDLSFRLHFHGLLCLSPFTLSLSVCALSRLLCSIQSPTFFYSNFHSGMNMCRFTWVKRKVVTDSELTCMNVTCNNHLIIHTISVRWYDG